MSEPVLKQRPSIDLDDFERRLRQATAAPDHRQDPLAELARLVGEPYDPLGDVFAQDTSARDTFAQNTSAWDAQQARDVHQHAASGNMPDAMHQAPEHAREPGFAPDVPRLFGDFSAIEAGLRATQQGHMPQQGHASQQGFGSPGQAEAGYVQAGQLPLDQDGEWAGVAPGEAYAAGYGEPRERAPSHARRPMMLMGVSIAVGVLGIGAAFALKGRVASSPREVKTIMADATPTKIQPPPDAAGDAGAADGFGKGNAVQPTRLVGREEQPVDIGQAVQENLARAAQPGAATDAASVPVPPSPSQMHSGQTQGGQTQGRPDPIAAEMQGLGLAEMPAPKRVKVVSVRPDGSIVPNDAAGAQPARTADAAAKSATPMSATPKAAAGKTTSRVSAKGTDKPAEEKTIDEIAADGDKPARKTKPQRVATAETEEAAAVPEPAAEGGNFAVQLAAPTSESDAKSASSRLSKKFSDTLGGRRIAIRKAESNGKSVYRVRVSSLSRSEATSLCDKLKADGGSCFVAKN